MRSLPLALLATIACVPATPGHVDLYADPVEVDAARGPELSVAIANVGDADARVVRVELSGEQRDRFEVGEVTLPVTLAAGEVLRVPLSVLDLDGLPDDLRPFETFLVVEAEGLAPASGCGGGVVAEGSKIEVPLLLTDPSKCDRDGDGVIAEPCGGEDCDDLDEAVHPEAGERCNEVDDDCDGELDEDPVEGTSWWSDRDGDGFGDPETEALVCEAPPLGTDQGEDCDDADAARFPGAPEVCNGLDDDCDGDVDELGAEGEQAFYHDGDGDGFGDLLDWHWGCAPPDDGRAWVLDEADCDDTAVDVHPDASEQCNGRDDDCDGLADEDGGGGTFYEDVDGDGFGDPLVPVEACAAPAGFVADDQDCDDLAAAVHPGAPETCNGLDDDCDGTRDDGLPSLTFHADADGDAFGDPAPVTACALPPGHVQDDTDCDDADPAVHPGATEHCDDADEDCDGVADEDAVDPATFHADTDGDGFGDPAVSEQACDPSAGFVEDGTDCDDGDPGVHPGAAEVCDDLDQDCDGVADDGAVDAETWYEDADGDTWGADGTGVRACDAPAGHVLDPGDCDDADPAVNPGAVEACNAADDDCSGLADDGAGTCPCPVRHFEDRAYGFCTDVTLPFIADFQCQEFGYRQVVLEDAAEDAFVSATAAGFTGGPWWIGYSDFNQDGRYTWVTGATPGYTNWRSGYPTSGFFDSFAELNQGGDPTWTNAGLFDSRPFICEQP